MLSSLSPATRVFLAVQPIDMRRSFNGLYADVQTVLGQDPLSGHLFKWLLDCARPAPKEPSFTDHPPVSSAP